MATYEDAWYRAKVIEIEKNWYTVVYIDYTNEQKLTSANIRRYPADLRDPCCTNLCLINGTHFVQ